jgi:polyisoprenoid-binding protein YceI
VTLTGTLADSVNPFTKAKTRGFTATTQINRKDFGLVWNMALETGGVLVSDEVNITVNAELVPAAPAAAPTKK